MKLSFRTDFENAWYQVTSSNRTIAGTKVLEFVQDRWVQIQLINEDEKQRVFEYTLLDQTMEGSALIHDWAADMEWLQSPVQVITNLEGKFIGIDNFSSFLTQWNNGYRAKIANKYQNREGIQVMLAETEKLLKDPKRFLQNFMGYSHYRCFFQPFYKELENVEEYPVLLKSFFGLVDLPLIINAHNEQTGDWIKTTNSAEIDNEKFDRKSFVRMMKDLTNTYNLKVDLQTEMEEIYLFKNNVLQSADLYLQLHVPSFYTVVNAHQCKRIEQAELPKSSSKKAGIFKNSVLMV
ncbi:hypothetical protein G7092_28020 [Mucilaginibacter sp. HC2]|uniref:hypothetical protein n=1 Tax=Mucilaginibacter inviolabilis TaxID=2714892 RepID=UPI00140B5156|nr:hypothetical protein [Mucilaginibacter inviolabilis]NHA07679.1 hypothetical protein [Mucilaginibacter inviolabilis]